MTHSIAKSHFPDSYLSNSNFMPFNYRISLNNFTVFQNLYFLKYLNNINIPTGAIQTNLKLR